MKDSLENSQKLEKKIILLLLNSTSPVSIDTLLTLIGTPHALAILNIMESLKNKRIVFEKRNHPKGSYFFTHIKLALYFKKIFNIEKTSDETCSFIELCEKKLKNGEEKTLLLSELYISQDNIVRGLEHIKIAADIFLLRHRQREKALEYYEIVLKFFETTPPNPKNAHCFTESTIKKYTQMRHLMTASEQISLLSKAHMVAKQYKIWDSLLKTKFHLSQLYEIVGKHKIAFQFAFDAKQLAESMANEELKKAAMVFMCEYFLAHGHVSEAIACYEESVGDLETFDNNPMTLQSVANLGLGYVTNGKIARGLGIIKAVRTRAEVLEFPLVTVSSDLVAALSLLEIQKWKEVKPYLDRIYPLPEDITGPFVLAVADRCMAYICMKKKDHKAADAWLTKSISRTGRAEWTHPKSSWWWLFELLDELEMNGFFHKNLNYDSEVTRLITCGDVHTKGVAFRCRALRNLMQSHEPSSNIADLENSEKFLIEAGAQMDLARTRIVLGEAYWKIGDAKRAHLCLGKAWKFLSRIGKNLFPRHLLTMIPNEQRIEFVIEEIVDINEALGVINDRSLFLEKVVNVAIDFSMASAGAFFSITHRNKPIITISRNLDPVSDTDCEFGLINQVVNQVAVDGVEVIVPGDEQNNSNLEAYLSNSTTTSLICLPVKLNDQTFGYLYLSNHVNGGAFSHSVLPYMRLISSQIALGLSKIDDYDTIKDLKNNFEQEAMFYKKEMGVTGPIETIIGKSRMIQRVIGQIQKVANTDSAVLILGETGVGKELVAKAIHNLSRRKDGPFIPVNIVALPAELVASELFGHEKGAFTGAATQTKGRFELADGGTIFLDEIGDLSLNIQVKLLRVLQEYTFERLGGAKSILSNFRVIAATNKDLISEVEKGAFRQDLYYRLNVFPIFVPPLRDRPEDILPLAQHFLDKFSRKMGKGTRQIPNAEAVRLETYNWPGNVRELEHYIEKTMILFDGKNNNFSDLLQPSAINVSSQNSASMTLENIERQHIESVLNTVRWKISGPNGAAEILGLKPTTLRAKMTKLGFFHNKHHSTS